MFRVQHVARQKGRHKKGLFQGSGSGRARPDVGLGKLGLKVVLLSVQLFDFFWERDLNGHGLAERS